MESSYRIGKLKSSYIKVNDQGAFYIEPDQNDEYERDDDRGEFEKHVRKILGDSYCSNGFPDFGWTWVMDGATLSRIIEEYNSTVKTQIFTDLEIDYNSQYYLQWIDWS